ncbi:hypothetical protein LZ32DRAFT_381653 [Colletotrichum eremochloae]|nr:hypothetical protein LZ32DRAFT_381653 [Colletotrichum eremochloae]
MSGSPTRFSCHIYAASVICCFHQALAESSSSFEQVHRRPERRFFCYQTLDRSVRVSGISLPGVSPRLPTFLVPALQIGQPWIVWSPRLSRTTVGKRWVNSSLEAGCWTPLADGIWVRAVIIS